MIFYLFGIFIYVVPGLWVNYTLNKHDDILPNMPFTAKEFGLNLLKEQDLENVKIEDTKIGDHYDPNSKTVRVKPDRLDKKSITSITVMCHEIGHAIQDKENYPPLIRRQKIISKTAWLNKISSLLLYAGIPAILATGALPFIRVCVLIIFASILITMISHLITLDVELDASFKRAMPILEKKIPVEYHSSCKSILRVCAFTYVIGSLTSILNLRNVWFLLRAVIFRRWLNWREGLELIMKKWKQIDDDIFVRDNEVGDKECFVGQLKNNLPDGKGKLEVYEPIKGLRLKVLKKIDPNWLIQHQRNFILLGLGEYFLLEKFIGFWKNGLLHGNAEHSEYHQPEFFINDDGTPKISERYVGTYKNGKKNGIFKNFFGGEEDNLPDIYYEEFLDDKLIKKIKDLSLVPKQIKNIK